MTDEDAFLRKLLAAPADDTTRLVYADWLDDRGESAKAEFLRLEAEVGAAAEKRRKVVDRRLQRLAADLETDWLAVVSKLTIERCGQSRQTLQHDLMQRLASSPPEPLTFEFECPKQWENLDATAEPGVRFCKGCREEVYYCDTITTARDHADEGHCVAVDLGIVRKPGDLDRVRMVMGKMLPRQAERRRAQIEAGRKPDPVSEKREEAKRQAGERGA